MPNLKAESNRKVMQANWILCHREDYTRAEFFAARALIEREELEDD
jgi:hypothetical protein